MIKISKSPHKTIPYHIRHYLDAVLLREPWGKYKWGRGVVAEPVGAGLVRLVSVDPDHDVSETQNLDQGGEKRSEFPH